MFNLLGIAAVIFAVSHVFNVLGEEGWTDIASVIGYIPASAVCVIMFRKRVKRIEITALLETVSLGLIAVMLVVLVQGYFKVSLSGILIQIVPLAAAMIAAVSYLGRKGNGLARSFTIAIALAAVMEIFDPQIPVDQWSRLWAIPWLPVLYGLGLSEQERTMPVSSISSRRKFGLNQQILFMSIQIATFGIVAISEFTGLSELTPTLSVIGVCVSVCIAYRLKLLIKLRDWSYNQELKLKSYAENIISLDDSMSLEKLTISTLESIADPSTKVGIIKKIDDGRQQEIVSENSVKISSIKSRLKPLRFGQCEKISNWFDSHTSGGSQICVEVPSYHDDSDDVTETYFVASTPSVINPDLESHFKSAAAQYSLALRTNELAKQVQEERANSRFNSLAQDSNDLIFIVDFQNYKINFTGPNTQRLLGYTSEEVTGASILDYMNQNDIELAVEELQRPTLVNESQVVDIRMQLADGKTRWFGMSVRDLTFEDNLNGLLINLSDINDRKLAGFNLKNSESRFRALVQNSSDVSMLIDADMSVVYVSPNIETMFNFKTEDLVGSSLLGFVSEESHNNLNNIFSRCKTSNQPEQAEIHVRTALGSSSRLSEISVAPSNLETGDTYVVTVRDITSRRQLENDLRSKAIYDDLTGLLNRSAFVYETQNNLRELDADATAKVVCLNLRQFKQLNDSAGFKVGDKILATVAARLRNSLEPGDKLARFSADEFAMAFTRPDQTLAEEQIAKLVKVFEKPFAIGNREYKQEVSIGITETSDKRQNTEQLIQQATVAMHKAKDTEATEPVMFEESMQQETAERFELAGELRSALNNNNFSLVYQPIISLEDNKVRNFEALLRWNHPERGNISPAVFIPLAESNGMIVEIGRWVLDQACKQLVSWKNQFPEFTELGLSVNLSAKQLEREDELNVLVKIIRDSKIDPTNLILELTESTMISDANRIHDDLNTLRELGIKIAIDDFGTGVSGLSHLRELPFDSIKIDKTFIDEIGQTQEGTLLVSQIIELSKAMGAYIVAEGIEQSEQVDILKTMGCELGQGFYLARPMPPEKLLTWIQARHVGNLASL